MWLGEGVCVWIRNYNCSQFKKIAWNLSIAIFFVKKTYFFSVLLIFVVSRRDCDLNAICFVKPQCRSNERCDFLFKSDFEACHVSFLLKRFDWLVSYSVQLIRAKVCGNILLWWDFGAPLALRSLRGMQACCSLWVLEKKGFMVTAVFSLNFSTCYEYGK